jgi:Leucine-rich repeat (LRR) protein
LTYLDLARNSISNLTPLSWLNKVTNLNLFRNNISSLNGLVGMVSLIQLKLRDNPITDISGLQWLVAGPSLKLEFDCDDIVVKVSKSSNLYTSILPETSSSVRCWNFSATSNINRIFQ